MPRILIIFQLMGCALAALAHTQGRQPRPAAVNLPETNPYSSTTDVEAGRKLYVGRCGHCHGLSGEGGRGAVLNTGRFRHGGTDRELFLVIRNGIPNTEMPGVFSLSEMEIWRMAAYVRQLGRQGALDSTTGDASAGSRAYQRIGCGACHAIDGNGGFLGPDLSDIGAKRSARHLRESIVSPDADIPQDYRSVSVITQGERNISGIHLNEDEYSIHLRDLNGSLLSFMKSELKEITLPRQSRMPAYSLSDDDLENLIAYLSSLRSTGR